jgi:uncharacterized protein (DUF111 family)
VTRQALDRHTLEVETAFGRVPIKVAKDKDEVRNAAPEFEVCLRLARQHRVPLKQVYAAALAAFYRR